MDPTSALWILSAIVQGLSAVLGVVAIFIVFTYEHWLNKENKNRMVVDTIKMGAVFMIGCFVVVIYSLFTMSFIRISSEVPAIWIYAAIVGVIFNLSFLFYIILTYYKKL